MTDRPHHPEPPPPTITALTRAFALLGKRWNGLVLAALAKGPVGFGEARERVPGISDRMLADRLHELTSAGLVTRTVLPGPPVRSQYALTAHGRAFLIPLAALAFWAEEHLMAPAEPRGPGPGGSRRS
ncbi:helix-turn-helix domain-containing protein [Streptomyces sp. GESEQ-4]|uniref:winged helix-turn-helix transcriptional regulator n=1 Tax=Streptomyces sp. GESEQ-4 TaxID=2812655 RepID=UPI001B328C28|nr:helix-turn-helix domain-containing protein [Streptomyces sp. GESEQ-4]